MDSKSPNRDSYVLNVFIRLLIGYSILHGTYILVHHLVGLIPTEVSLVNISGVTMYDCFNMVVGYISHINKFV